MSGALLWPFKVAMKYSCQSSFNLPSHNFSREFPAQGANGLKFANAGA